MVAKSHKTPSFALFTRVHGLLCDKQYETSDAESTDSKFCASATVSMLYAYTYLHIKINTFIA